MTDSDPSAELDTLFPEARRVAVAGVEYTITPPTVLQMAKIGKLLQRVINDGAQNSTVEMLLLSHTEEVAAVVAIATAQPEASIHALRSDHGLELAIAVWEVYAPFFGTRMLPLFASLAEKVVRWGGQTSSSS